MEELLNFYQSTANIGTSGQPSAAQIAQIASEGYASVINLAVADSDNAIAEEGSLVTSTGMSYFHIPVPFEAPTPAHLKTFFGLMALLENEKVFVHCAVNARVSAFMYQYLTLKKGLEPEQATSPLLKLWLPKMDDAWKSILALSLGEIEG